jgi:hypothetical protein
MRWMKKEERFILSGGWDSKEKMGEKGGSSINLKY